MLFWFAVLTVATLGAGDPCSPRSAEWLSSPRAAPKAEHAVALSAVSEGRPVKVSLPKGRFRLRVASVHRWDLVAGLQLLEWSHRGGPFLLPKLEWHEDREVTGPGEVVFARSRLGSWPWHLALITEVRDGAERLVWGRVLVENGLEALFQWTSAGLLAALFGETGPVSDEPVEILDQAGRILWSGRSGPDGTFVVGKRIHGRVLLVAGRGAVRALRSIDPPADSSSGCRFLRLWLGNGGALGPGDELALAGAVLGAQPGVSSLEVVLEEAGSSGRVIGQVRLSRDGLFGGTVRLPRDVVPGTAMLRIGTGRCEHLAWIHLVSGSGQDGTKLSVRPGRDGLDIQVDAHRSWIQEQKGALLLRWGWSRACGKESFAGGTAQACLDVAGRARVSLAIPEDGRCLSVRALVQDDSGWHRAATWWPGPRTLAVTPLVPEKGWFLGRPAGRSGELGLDEGSSWPCFPLFGFSVCPFHVSSPGRHLVWSEWESSGADEFLWAWVSSPSDRVGTRRDGLSFLVRRDGRSLIVRSKWRAGGGSGMVVLDWAGHVVHKAIADVRRTGSVTLSLPGQAVGPVEVSVVQVLHDVQRSASVRVSVPPARVWRVRPRGRLSVPAERICLAAEGRGKFLALRSASHASQGRSRLRRHGLLLGASGAMPSICLAAPSGPGRFFLAVVGRIGGRLSWYQQDRMVRRQGAFRLTGPFWVRLGDQVCLRLSGKVRAAPFYEFHGLEPVGHWPTNPGAGTLLCARVTGSGPRLTIRDRRGEQAEWSSQVRPLVPGPLIWSARGGVGEGGWLCAGRRCRLLPMLVRLVAEPRRDGQAQVAAALAWSCLTDTVSHRVLKTWMRGSVRSVPGLAAPSPLSRDAGLGAWLGPEGMVLSSLFGPLAAARVQAAAVWALVRMGRRREAAGLARSLTEHGASEGRIEDRLWSAWALLEAGLLPPRQGWAGRGPAGTALGLWVAARSGESLASLDRRLADLRRALTAPGTQAVLSGGLDLMASALVLHVLDELLPGHELGRRAAGALARALERGGGDLPGRAVAAAALWDHWNSALVQPVFLAQGGSGVRRILRCNGSPLDLAAVGGRAGKVGIRVERPRRCDVSRLAWSDKGDKHWGRIAWIRNMPLGRGSWMGLVFFAGRPMRRPCLRIPLPAGTRLERLSHETLGPVPVFPWQEARRSREGVRLCGPEALGTGIYSLFYRIRIKATGRYHAGGACLSDAAGVLSCTGAWNLAVSKESP